MSYHVQQTGAIGFMKDTRKNPKIWLLSLTLKRQLKVQIYLCKNFRISCLPAPSSSHAFENFALSCSALILIYLSFLAWALINTLSYFDTHGFTRPFCGNSVPASGNPGKGLENIPGPYLEEFKSYVKIFREICSSSRLVYRKGLANSKIS